MDVWKSIPYRVQKMLAHVRSEFMNVSGVRQSRLVLVRDNRKLRGENSGLRTSIDERVSDGIGTYVYEARQMMTEYDAASKALVASAISRNIPHVSDRMKAHYIPNSSILPIVINALSMGDRRFKKLPLSIWYEGENVYMSSSFSKACSLDTGGLSELIDANAEEIGKLKHGRAHNVCVGETDLVINRFEAPGIDSVNTIGIYALPNRKDKRNVSKVIGNAGADTISSIREAYRRLATPEDVGGLANGAV